MFNKLLKKFDEIKDEVVDQASKQIGDVVGDAISEKKPDLFSSLMGKFTDMASSSFDYLTQVEKMASEKKAQELGITSRELQELTLEEIAAKYGMTVEQYQEKVKKEAEQYKNNNILGSAKILKERSEIELIARQNQAEQLEMTLEAFDELTLQEQADKLNVTLDALLNQRALNF